MGRAAMERKEHHLAEAQLFGALAIFRTLGARVDALALYKSLEQFFRSRGDLQRAEEMAAVQKDEAFRRKAMPRLLCSLRPPRLGPFWRRKNSTVIKGRTRPWRQEG